MRLRLLLAALAALAVVCLGCGPVPSPTEQPGDDGVALWDEVWDPDTFEVPEREPCSEAFRASLLEPGDPAVVDCHLTLQQGDVVQRRLVLRGGPSSGVRVQCLGAMLAGPSPAVLVRSDCSVSPCEPVHDVTIGGCAIRGGVHIRGLANSGSDPVLLETDQTLEHVSTVRAAAPFRVMLESSVLDGDGHMPLHVAPGVHDCEFRDLEIGGESPSVMVYADSETDRLHFRRVEIDASAGLREAFAADGSARGLLHDCDFVSPRGCVHDYRNCGEAAPGAPRGVIRQTTSSSWRVTDSRFVCGGSAIWFGSRGADRSYCHDDEPGGGGEPIGSWLSNFDHVRHWRGTGNRFHGCETWDGDKTNTDNEVTE